MLKKIIAFLIVIQISFSSICQNVSIGPIIGLNYSKVSNSSASKYKAGFNGGLFFNYSTKTDFGFNGSLIYSQLGGKVEKSSNFIKLNYLQIPVNLVYFFGEGMRKGSLRPKLFFGPYIGFLFDAQSPGFTSAQTLEQMNSTDLGLNIGGGFNFAIKSKTWINIDLKYGHGLVQVPKVLQYQNRALSLNVGLSFPLGNYDKKTGRLN